MLYYLFVFLNPSYGIFQFFTITIDHTDPVEFFPLSQLRTLTEYVYSIHNVSPVPGAHLEFIPNFKLMSIVYYFNYLFRSFSYVPIGIIQCSLLPLYRCHFMYQMLYMTLPSIKSRVYFLSHNFQNIQ